MTTFAITDTQGALVSVGTVIADPLPAGLTATALAPIDIDGLRTGARRWVPATLTTEPTPGYVDPAIGEANGSAIRASATTALATLQTVIDTGPATFANVATAQTVVRGLQGQVQDMARINRKLVRYIFDLLDAAN